MPRISHLAGALALALAGVTSVQAQTFTNVINIGDSVTDGGNYTGLIPGAQSFTTNPDPVFIELVAAEYGFVLTPSTAANNGGFNFAWGGAPTGPGFLCVPTTLPCRNGTTQLANYFARTGGTADPNALYSVFLGANNIFNILGGAPAATALPASIQQELGIISALQTAGARNILVYNLPDIGRFPFGTSLGPANAATVSVLVNAFNNGFNTGLAQLGDGIIPINVFGLVNELLADPTAYGFSNTTGTACNLAVVSGSLFCTPAAYTTPTANQTFAFADGVHPTGATHALIAKVVIATLAAPGQVSMAGEMPLQVYDNHSNVINQQIFGMSRTQRSPGETNVYGQLQYGRQDFNAGPSTSAFDNDVMTGTFGADVRYSDAISLGASVTVGRTDGDSFGSSVESTEVLLSGYGIAHFGSGYLNAIATGGSANFDIDRSIVLGPTTRVEEGNTSASHVAFEIGGGFTFGSDDFRHGPFASVTWQKIEVDGYVEDSLDSTSMYFGDFNRKSVVTRVGYQAQGMVGNFKPFARVAWAKEGQDRIAGIQAGSNSMNGHFTLDGFVHSEDWVEADLGVNYAISDATDISFGYRGRMSDDTMDSHSVHLGFRTEFGGDEAPAPEPVEVVQTSCSDLDDDGDGINNCNDKCPGSATGEAVGADGCPMPAAEPEPVMEPKAFKG